MNKHILLVMKWLNDKDSVSQEELARNKSEADAACWAATDAAYDAAYAAWAAAAYADAYATNAAYEAAYADAADWAAAYWAADAAYWVDVYFDRTGESRNEYLKELNK